MATSGAGSGPVRTSTCRPLHAVSTSIDSETMRTRMQCLRKVFGLVTAPRARDVLEKAPHAREGHNYNYSSPAPRLSVDQVLSSRFPKSVRRPVLLVDQHVGIVATQKCLSHRGRAKSQIEVVIVYRESRARRLVDSP